MKTTTQHINEVLHYMDEFPGSGQNREAAVIIRELLSAPSSPLVAVSDNTTQKLLKALERISKAGVDCGYSPCVGQCQCDEANEINLQGCRDLADETLAEYRALAGQVAPQATVERSISNDESEPDFWPIAKLTVEDGKIAAATFYAPGLPDGVHDVFPAPTHLDEHTAAWYGVVQALDAAAPGWQCKSGKNGIEAAASAIQQLATPTAQATVEPLTDAEAICKGRAEAVAILLGLSAEDGLNECIDSVPFADTGDYDTVWNEAKLHELFRTSDTVWSMSQEVTGEYYRYKYLADELQERLAATPPTSKVTDESALSSIQDQLTSMLHTAAVLTDAEFVTGYQIKTGALHSILGTMQGAGFPVEIPLPQNTVATSKADTGSIPERMPDHVEEAIMAELYQGGLTRMQGPARLYKAMRDALSATPSTIKAEPMTREWCANMAALEASAGDRAIGAGSIPIKEEPTGEQQ